MYKESNKQTSFFGNMVYDYVIPQDHFLRRLSSAIDLSFINELVKDLYCPDNGRPCWEPQVVFKMLLLQYLYDLSDINIENEVNDRLSFKWFLGLDVNQSGPDATTLVRFRDRLGEERFAKIFNRIVQLTRKSNLISDKLHIVDATAIRAKVDTWRIKRVCKDKKDSNYIDRASPDKDARLGHTSPKGTVYGYKGYLCMDKKNEIIVSEFLSPANQQEANHLPGLISNPPPKELCGDRAYDTPQNQQVLKDNQVRSSILRKQPATKKRLRGCFYNPLVKQSNRTIKRIKRIRNCIEHKIAELKRWHGLGVCRYWGLTKTKIQHTLTCIAVNLKRIVNILFEKLAPPGKVTIPAFHLIR